MTSEQRAVRDWQRRHEQQGDNPPYFVGSPIHTGWHVYPEPYHWFVHLVKPSLNDVVLDLGCGYGEWMIPHSRLVKWISGVDLHDSLIRKAEELFNVHHVINADVKLGDGTTIPYSDESFDVVQSCALFYHTPRVIVRRYLPETFRVLKIGGRMAHLFLKEDAPGCPKDIGLDRDGQWSAAWSVSDLLAVAIQAGFKSSDVIDLGDAQMLVGIKE